MYAFSNQPRRFRKSAMSRYDVIIVSSAVGSVGQLLSNVPPCEPIPNAVSPRSRYDVMFASKVVEFSTVTLMSTPLVALALRKVLFDTNVPTRVTLIKIDPEIVLFSTRLFVTVEFVIFTLNARTVSRLE